MKLGASKPFFLSLSCTKVGTEIHRWLGPHWIVTAGNQEAGTDEFASRTPKVLRCHLLKPQSASNPACHVMRRRVAQMQETIRVSGEPVPFLLAHVELGFAIVSNLTLERVFHRLQQGFDS